MHNLKHTKSRDIFFNYYGMQLEHTSAIIWLENKKTTEMEASSKIA